MLHSDADVERKNPPCYSTGRVGWSFLVYIRYQYHSKPIMVSYNEKKANMADIVLELHSLVYC